MNAEAKDKARSSDMTTERERARDPEHLTRLFVQRAKDGDAEGLTELYAPDAIMAYPPGQQTAGREAIRAVLEKLLSGATGFQPEKPLPTIRYGDLALTSTRALDGTGGRVQVVRRQPDGTWLRIIDRPEMPD
jgi:uncharacterized protein (TIGR02246 family)